MSEEEKSALLEKVYDAMYDDGWKMSLQAAGDIKDYLNDWYREQSGEISLSDIEEWRKTPPPA
jgi:hypothetical protein